MINHIKIVCLLIVSSLILAQPTPTPTDSSKAVSTEIPPTVKPVVEEIVINSKESQEATEQISKEMKKQISLMKQIKTKINELKKSSPDKKASKVPVNIEKVVPSDTFGLKAKDTIIQVQGQIIQFEPKNRSWVGRLLHKSDIIYYPFIYDLDGNKIYLKITD
jgi:hypothetical protein